MVYGVPSAQLRERQRELSNLALVAGPRAIVYDADALYHSMCILCNTGTLRPDRLATRTAQDIYLDALAGESEGDAPDVVGRKILRAARMLTEALASLN